MAKVSYEDRPEPDLSRKRTRSLMGTTEQLYENAMGKQWQESICEEAKVSKDAIDNQIFAVTELFKHWGAGIIEHTSRLSLGMQESSLLRTQKLQMEQLIDLFDGIGKAVMRAEIPSLSHHDLLTLLIHITGQAERMMKNMELVQIDSTVDNGIQSCQALKTLDGIGTERQLLAMTFSMEVKKWDLLNHIAPNMPWVCTREMEGMRLGQHLSEIEAQFQAVSLCSCSSSSTSKFGRDGSQKQLKSTPLFSCDSGIMTYEDHEKPPLQVLERLGTGGYGLIEKVKHQDTLEVYARKTMKGDSKKKARALLEKELQNLRHLQTIGNHIHIVELVGAYQWRKNMALLLRPVASYNLAELLAEESLDFDKTEFLMKSHGCLASGLLYIHNSGMRHKDIKPENILVRDQNIMYTDFGTSLCFQDNKSRTSGRPEAWTQRYCAPEVANYSSRGRSADIFSLGCVYIEMISCLLGHDENEIDELLSGNADEGDDSVYHRNLQKIQVWMLRCVLDMERNETDTHSESNEGQKFSKDILPICGEMVQAVPSFRPEIAEVVEKMLRSPMRALAFCSSCTKCFQSTDGIFHDHGILRSDPVSASTHECFSVELKIERSGVMKETSNDLYTHAF